MTQYGEVSGHLIGLAMKEAVRRAIEVIRAKRFMFEVEQKGVNDPVTTADRAAQAVYLKLLRESFPTFGIVGEEDNLSIPSTHPGHDIWFTVDPLDGTKAFVRKQSHGIGTMISLVMNGEVIAAYVGDVMTKEIYGFRPGSPNVHRISDFGSEKLLIDEDNPLKNQYILLRDRPDKYSGRASEIFEFNYFKDMEITGGSIGISVARLWKGEVGAVVLSPGKQTPWDRCPVVGISKRMGFRFLTLTPEGLVTDADLSPSKETIRTQSEVIILHESRLEEFHAI